MPIWNFIGFIIETINRVLVPLIFAIAFIVFIWGIFQFFIAGAADEEKRKQGKQFILYGFIGFFLMVSIWGIVNLLVGTFGFGGAGRPALPFFGSPTGSGGFGGSGTESNAALGRACDNDTVCGGLSCTRGRCSDPREGTLVTGENCNPNLPLQCASRNCNRLGTGPWVCTESN